LTLAAVEAWKQCGGDQTAEAVQALYAQVLAAKEASDADNLVDDDGDGLWTATATANLCLVE
jgi:hypothetical protein